jgi:hypothetical protein
MLYFQLDRRGFDSAPGHHSVTKSLFFQKIQIKSRACPGFLTAAIIAPMEALRRADADKDYPDFG